mmetsp:Transcript_24507/g.53543  ORF Transcript_24507/g.53543 Transcript_24507/m.53543 type:complete len:95 (+) Transcript_24507:202-486(+)|eukprot:CAMPEP_0202915926 /NCGR_PEP_ID=MMETSP1392-20130828/67085_1 /ASSEMBLY_ACC=CAM_ASM_000868 /TAXON_ID=225041 /ORGANISM="Chlamydomonas chlamydogama, Strain SAG 11-48b" /LENGTH=94 /DNA_ID=CAMNT_0049608133 /DNA_START=135 /DNA_END=419 /DNA_ORIENTATION=-
MGTGVATAALRKGRDYAGSFMQQLQRVPAIIRASEPSRDVAVLLFKAAKAAAEREMLRANCWLQHPWLTIREGADKVECRLIEEGRHFAGPAAW